MTDAKTKPVRTLPVKAAAPPPVEVHHPNLATALAAFQKHAPKVSKDNTANVRSDKGAYSYTYADLATISEAVLPALAVEGLAWTTRPTIFEGSFVLVYELLHGDSGEKIEGIYPLPNPGGSPQATGSAITYAKRYTLCAVTGVAPDEDDDGQAAQQQATQRPQQPPQRRPEPPVTTPAPVAAQAAPMVDAKAYNILSITTAEDARRMFRIAGGNGHLGHVLPDTGVALGDWLRERGTVLAEREAAAAAHEAPEQPEPEPEGEPE